MKLSLGYITAPTKKEAKKLAEALLSEGLIACANIIPAVESLFVWEGEIQKANEAVLIIKTREKNEDKIIKFVERHHSYECPCVVFLPITNGHAEFLRWVDGSCE